MRNTLAAWAALLLVAVAAPEPAAAAPIRGLDRPSRIPNDYIVVLRDPSDAPARSHPNGSSAMRSSPCSSTASP